MYHRSLCYSKFKDISCGKFYYSKLDKGNKFIFYKTALH